VGAGAGHVVVLEVVVHLGQHDRVLRVRQPAEQQHPDHGQRLPDGTNTSVAATTEAVIVTQQHPGPGVAVGQVDERSLQDEAPAEPRATNSAVRPMPKPLRVA
jgi:hypothetical protein